jgi:hypothetical protein
MDDLVKLLRSGVTSVKMPDGSVQYVNHVAADRFEELVAAIIDWSESITDWIGNDFFEQIENETSRSLIKGILDRAALKDGEE